MERAEFLQSLSQILDPEGGVLTDDQPVEPMLWDSIEIMGAIELIDRAGVTVKVADVLGCQSVADLVRLAGCASAGHTPVSADLSPGGPAPGLIPDATTSRA